VSLGVPLELDLAHLAAARWALGGVCAALSALYLAAEVHTFRKTRSVNLQRNLFVVATVGGHALMNLSSDVFLLSAHEKLYHALQYGSLCWLALQQRKDRPEAKHDFAGWLARRGGVLAFLAVTAGWTGLVFALDLYAQAGASPHAGPTAFSTLVSAVALTHYYFDSFLWLRPGPKR
jgi:hypothetical protein